MRFIALLFVALLVGCDVGQPSRTAPTPTDAQPDLGAAEEPRSAEPESVSLPEPEETKPDKFSEDAKARLRRFIARRKVLDKQLWDFAKTINDYNHIGTMYNEIGLPEGRCFAAGTLLGQDKLVEHLNNEIKPDLETRTMENAQELRVLGQEHANFAGAAEHLLELDRDEVIVIWNLDCPGFHDIPKSSYIVQKGKSSFYEVRNDGHVLMVRGDIEEGFADKIIEALKANPSVKTVGLGSGGGYVHEAMRAGVYLRRNGYDTVLWNGCYSACPLVFMAGDQRQIWSPYPYLGFHQVFTQDGTAVPPDDGVYKAIYQYLLLMNIEPRYVLEKMWSAPPHEMANVFGYEPELCDANIATWIQRGCSSRDYESPQD